MTSNQPLPVLLAVLLAAGIGAAAAGERTPPDRAPQGEAEIGEVLKGAYFEFRAYNLYDLRRPREDERDLRVGETLYRVDEDDLTIKQKFPLREMVLN